MKEELLAIPSNDRLKNETLSFLQASGVSVCLDKRHLLSEVNDESLGRFKIVLLRSRDIIRRISEGRIEVGIVGLDNVEEYNLGLRTSQTRESSELEVLLKLGISKCRLALSAPNDSNFVPLADYKGIFALAKFLHQFKKTTIATCYPFITANYFYNIENMLDLSDLVDFHLINDLTGSLEVAPALGDSDIIADIVQTGDSLKANQLRELVTIFDSEAVLVKRKSYNSGSSQFTQKLLKKFKELLNAE